MAKTKGKVTSNINSQITSIAIDSDLAVKIGFAETVPSSGGEIIDAKSKGNGAEDEEEMEDDGRAFITTGYVVNSQRRAHKDFVDAMKGLRKFGLEICEIKIDSKDIGPYTVAKISIAGDVTMKQSRVVMNLTKSLKSTDKLVKIGPTRQVTMYGDSDYAKANEMSKQIEKCIDEAYLYLDGKAEEDNQLPLFAKKELQLA